MEQEEPKTKTNIPFLRPRRILPKTKNHRLANLILRGKRYLIDTTNDYAYHISDKGIIEDFAGILSREDKRIIYTDYSDDTWTHIPESRIDPYLLKKIKEPDSDDDLPIQLKVVQEKLKANQ